MVDPREAVDGVLECRHCGMLLTFPKPDSKVLSFLQQGEHDLDSCDFDRAHAAYSKAAELDPAEPEAYFGMALAAFKVQYLKDEVHGCLQPICHEISKRVFTEDPNYQKALEFATDEQKEVYHVRGHAIDSIREEFYELEKSGLDYDCFLCAKVTESGEPHCGTHTADCERANDIYHYLKDNGYKPFFSEREMKGRVGSAYEALILYALYTSECMLIVCSDEAYLQTKWVKNEYLRFLKMMKSDDKERDALTFVFYGKPIDELPFDTSKKIQGIDFSKERDAYPLITKYVEEHTPGARAKRAAAEKARREEDQKRAEELRALQEKIAKIEEEKATAASVPAPKFSLMALFTAIWNFWKQRRERKAEEKRKLQEEEERKRQEEEFKEKPWLAPDYPTLKNYDKGLFEIKGTTLVKFRYNEPQEEVKIPRGVTKIGDSVFEACTGLAEIIIPDSVTSIGEKAFSNCDSLTFIMIPDSVTEIGDLAFYGCIGLSNITIPNGVTSIGYMVFEECNGLRHVEIPNTVTKIGDEAFCDCTSLISISNLSGVTSIGAGAFYGCYRLRNIRIPQGLVLICNLAFSCCIDLKSIVIPKSVALVGRNAFEDCPNLKIYCEAERKPNGWDGDWNHDNRPVVWGYKG